MVREIVELGFERIELSHGIRLTLVAELLRAVDEGLAEVTSVHNFCPLPPGVVSAAPNLYEPSDPRLSEVRQWYSHTCKTIEFASQVRAKTMVVHFGSVGFPLLNPVARTLHRLREGKLPVNDIAAMTRIWAACSVQGGPKGSRVLGTGQDEPQPITGVRCEAQRSREL
jgi:sugar phosphate isomerase/epimerase